MEKEFLDFLMLCYTIGTLIGLLIMPFVTYLIWKDASKRGRNKWAWCAANILIGNIAGIVYYFTRKTS